MNSIKFSILITSYNKKKYIEECIDSCLSQNHNNYEIILIDNYSDDGSEKIFKQYSDKIKILQKKKISKYAPVNQIDLLINGFKLSSGSIISFLDGDDYFFKEKLFEIEKIFLSQKDIDVVFDIPIIKDKTKLTRFVNKKKFQKNIWPTIIPTSSICMRRSFFDYCLNKGLFNDFFNLEVDFRINVLCRNIKNNYFISQKKLTVYRKVENGIMSNINKYEKKWWQKRLEAHNFMKILYLNNKDVYKNKLDYYLTKFLSKI
tara:strand:- start:180 stop:959 length:780 start_codon:yes stop_codon:yes gene_type:complete